MLTNEKIKEFCSSFGRDGIDMGEIEFSENEINIPDSIKVDFNGQLKYFYSHLKFTKLITGGEFFIQIFPLERLESSQVGWRWIKNGEIVENTTSWRDNWVVFGDRNGDAIYCDTSTEDNSVYGTIQGRRHFLLANSMSDFIEILSECLLMEKDEFNFETQDDDFVPKEEFIQRVNEIVVKYSSGNVQNEFMAFFFE